VTIVNEKKYLDAEALKKHLRYDQDTGLFIWISRTIGKVAGCLSKESGYVKIRINDVLYLAHRLAWLYVEGYWPEHEIDHINGVRNDNRRANLRHVTGTCNAQNTKIFETNTSGYPGVSWSKERRAWESKINISDKTIHLGRYHTPIDAALARYTFESQCPKRKCNRRSELAKAIKRAWPEFNTAQNY